MKTTTEREIKLSPGGPVQLDGHELPNRTLVSVYHDTADLRLVRAGITLRRREGEGEPVWQLKLGAGQDRLELEWPAPTSQIPHELQRLIFAHTRGRVVSAVATLRTERTGVRVQDGGDDVADVTEDRVDVLEDERVAWSFEELEIESLNGDMRALRRLEKELRRAGAEDPDGRPKVFRALGVAVAEPPPPHSSRQCLQAALRAQYERILEHDPGTRLGRDPEHVHKQRVAVRRLRAHLRAGRPLLDRQWADGLRDELRPLGHALGRVRDLDVQISRIESQATLLEEPGRSGTVDLLEQLRERRDSAHRELVGELSETWYVGLLNRVEQAVEAPVFAGRGSLRKRAAREHRRLAREVRSLPKRPSDARLHEIRKRVRRARYAAELSAACGGSGLKKYIDRSRRLQDLLGEHQDAAVESRLLGDLAGEGVRVAARLAADDLQELQRGERAALRSSFPRAWRMLQKRHP